MTGTCVTTIYFCLSSVYGILAYNVKWMNWIEKFLTLASLRTSWYIRRPICSINVQLHLSLDNILSKIAEFKHGKHYGKSSKSDKIASCRLNLYFGIIFPYLWFNIGNLIQALNSFLGLGNVLVGFLQQVMNGFLFYHTMTFFFIGATCLFKRMCDRDTLIGDANYNCTSWSFNYFLYYCLLNSSLWQNGLFFRIATF